MVTPDKPATLTPKQARFVAEYLKDLNGTQAAIRAGFSARTAQVKGSQLLSKPLVAAALKTAQEHLAADAALSAALEVSDGDEMVIRL